MNSWNEGKGINADDRVSAIKLKIIKSAVNRTCAIILHGKSWKWNLRS